MAERELAILLTARNLASKGIRSVTGDVNKLGKASRKIGPSLKTIGVGIGALAGGAALFVGASVKSGLDSLVTLEAANATTQAVIKSTGNAAKVSADEVRNWAEEIERATGAAVDDKAIQAAENVLLRSGAVTHAMFQRVATDAVDLGAAMKTGPEAGAKTLAKALANPVKAVGALRKAGIFLTAAEEKQIKSLVKHNKLAEAQAIILGRVEKATKGAAAASAGPLQRSQNMLADTWEDAKMALATGFLPLITRVGDTLSKELGKPETIRQIRGLGQGLADGFENVLDAVEKIPWGSVKDAMNAVATGAKNAANFFLGLPPWVQTAVLTGWGLNKITGGVVGDVFSAAATGLIKGVLGMNAGVVTINAGAVNSGGIPGAAGGAAAGGLSAASKVFIVGEAIGLGLLVNEVRTGVQTQLTGQAKGLGATNTAFLAQNPSLPAMQKSLAAIDTGIAQLEADPLAVALVTGPALDELKTMRENTVKQIKALESGQDKYSEGMRVSATAADRLQAKVSSGMEGMRAASNATAAAARIAGVTAAQAIRDKDLSVTTNVTVHTKVSVSARQAATAIVVNRLRSQAGNGMQPGDP